jgi:hypothetical protein
MSGTTKCVLVRKARGSLFVADDSIQNCKEFSNLYYTNKHYNTKKVTYSPSYTEHVAALILYLFHSLYTLRHILSEIIVCTA